VSIKPGERGSWPRGSVRLIALHKRVGAKGGTLQLAGEQPFPVTCDGDPSTDELVEALSHRHARRSGLLALPQRSSG